MNTWKKCEEEFVSFFDDQGKDAYVIRLADTAAAKATGGAEAMIQAQPSDFIVVVKGVTHFSEVKSCQNPTSFPFSNIKRGQKIAARRVVKAGGSYLFWIKNIVTGVWYCVPSPVIINHPRKSIRWDELEQYIWNTQIA